MSKAIAAPTLAPDSPTGDFRQRLAGGWVPYCRPTAIFASDSENRSQRDSVGGSFR
jgi:hypothetical protein